jgi:hypothetical protein
VSGPLDEIDVAALGAIETSAFLRGRATGLWLAALTLQYPEAHWTAHDIITHLQEMAARDRESAAKMEAR